MGRVRVKNDEDTTFVEGMMGSLAEDLGKLLGIGVHVLRTKEMWQPPGGYREPQIKYKYQIVVTHADNQMAFGSTSNPNEIKRSLAMLVDMIHMGFIKSEETCDEG